MKKVFRIAVVDGMGGGIGTQLISLVKQELTEEVEIIALGTNSTATTAMLKAGAHRGATGENAIRVNLQEVDVVIGPLGIIITDALMGEISANIAHTIATVPCRKFLLPISQSHVELIGIENRPLSHVLKDAVQKLREVVKEKMLGEV